MINEVMADTEERMDKAIESLHLDLRSIRTGHASTALVERLMVEYYGTPTPLQQLATISTPDAQTLVIRPYSPSDIGAIEKAIAKSDLHLTPNNDGQQIRLIIPPLTEERRRELTKVVAKRAEEARVAVRNIRRDAIHDLREMEKEHMISEDELRRGQEKIQDKTDTFIKQVDEIAREKDEEIMKYDRCARLGKLMDSQTNNSHAPLESVPFHVGIIMDGNGRWARARGWPRLVGHQAGVDNIQRILEASVHHGIKVLTIYAFSTENWHRPQDEVTGLMRLLGLTIRRQLNELDKNGVQIRHSGRMEGINPELQKQIRHALEVTQHNDRIILNVAFNYGGRAEILDAVRHIMQDKIDPDALNEEIFSRYLYTSNLPDPDLIIRTGGQWRLSNFLIWQAAYAEYYTTPTYWPAFDEEELYKALEEYGARERRFGRVLQT